MPKAKPEDLIFINRKLDEATAEMTQKGIRWRITHMNGTGVMVTRDYIPERLNLRVQDNKITGIDRG